MFDFFSEKKILCPYCFDKFEISNNTQSRKRLCPSCHKDLPPYIEDIKNRIFAVVGSKNAGKSHYIAVLIKQIEEIQKSMSFTLRSVGEKTRKRYKDDFYEPLFKNKIVINTTQSAEVEDSQVGIPLIFRLDFIKDTFFEKNKKYNSSLLAFFDTAGEDMKNEEKMMQFNRYIFHSKGIIFLIDPLQIPGLQKGIKKVEQEESIADILERIMSIIEHGKELDPSDKINIPIAIAFTKFDAIYPFIDNSYQIKQPKNKIYDESYIDAISSEMKSLLMSWGEDGFVHKVETNFKNYKFFGVSALGHEPIEGEIGEIKPRRVEDPFLWLLKINNLLKVK